MKATEIKKRAVAVACAAAIASFAFAGNAFAATVHGADYHGSGSALESGEVDVLNVDGTEGETVFLTVKRGDTTLAQNLAYTIGPTEKKTDDETKDEWAGIATLDIAGLNLNLNDPKALAEALDGTYTVQAYADRAGSNLLYSGALYGVYADLPDDSQKLIGTRVANGEEAAARAYQPPETLYVNGQTYRLASKPGPQALGAMHFAYVAYDESTTVDGVIKYVDNAGNTVATTKVPGLANGEVRTEEIPTAVTADNGDLYRTVYFANEVEFKNPGKTSYTVYCTQMSEAAKALSGFYIATLQMVDQNGKIIATDSVNVTGKFVYTAPSTIYKTEVLESGETAVVEYRLAKGQDQVISLSAANDKVLSRARTIQVSYEAQPLDSTDVTVTFNLIDGTKRAKDGRSLGTLQLNVNAENPVAQPEMTIEKDGVKYYLAGDPSNYEYTFRSGAIPAVDVYYTPEGYTPPAAYDVTVNYVDFLSGAVLESHTYTSDPNENARISIETPANFSANGVDYVRLTGQEDAIAHGYFSGVATYTVYYRDVNDDLSADVVISKIRVVYDDSQNAGVDALNNDAVVGPGGAEGTDAAGAGTAGGADGTDAAAGTAGTDAAAALADGAQALALNTEGAYNVMDGAGNTTLTNASGVDSNTERITDSETPLSSGFDKGASSSAASAFSQMSGMLVPLGIALVVAIAAIAVLTVVRRRLNDDPYKA